MEKAKEYVRENLQGNLKEPIEELSFEDRDTLKNEINNLLHTYLPPNKTLAETETIAMLIFETIINPDYFISE